MLDSKNIARQQLSIQDCPLAATRYWILLSRTRIGE